MSYIVRIGHLKSGRKKSKNNADRVVPVAYCYYKLWWLITAISCLCVTDTTTRIFAMVRVIVLAGQKLPTRLHKDWPIFLLAGRILMTQSFAMFRVRGAKYPTRPHKDLHCFVSMGRKSPTRTTRRFEMLCVVGAKVADTMIWNVSCCRLGDFP